MIRKYQVNKGGWRVGYHNKSDDELIREYDRNSNKQGIERELEHRGYTQIDGDWHSDDSEEVQKMYEEEAETAMFFGGLLTKMAFIGAFMIGFAIAAHWLISKIYYYDTYIYIASAALFILFLLLQGNEVLKWMFLLITPFWVTSVYATWLAANDQKEDYYVWFMDEMTDLSDILLSAIGFGLLIPVSFFMFKWILDLLEVMFNKRKLDKTIKQNQAIHK